MTTPSENPVMTGVDLDALEKVALGATRSSWRAYTPRGRSPEVYTDGAPAHTPNPLICGKVIRKADVRHIATFDPPTVLKLIALARQATPPHTQEGSAQPLTVELTADFARGLPGGKMDDSAFEEIETALDRADAPCQGPDGKWLTLPERIAALAAGQSPSGSVGDGWVMVPREPTPEMIAKVAVAVQPATLADYALGREALQFLPPSDHPEVADVLAELIRDYRAMIAASPTLSGGAGADEGGWQPIETAPKDGTVVDLREGAAEAYRCRWSLCDVGWSQHGRMMWAMAPHGMKPTHWRLSQPSDQT